MTTGGRVVSINVSQGGVPKLAVERAIIRKHGVIGDRQKNLKYHGGPERAVSLYSQERIDALRAEGHSIAPGTVGENLTVRGLDWDSITPGTLLRVGQARLEVTSYVVPCRTIRASFLGERFGRISQKTNPGWARVYAKVIEEGAVQVADLVDVIGVPLTDSVTITDIVTL